MILTWKKTALYILAMILLGSSVAFIQSTNLGMSAWDALHRNFYEGIPLEYKYLTMISAIILVGIAYLIEWKKPKLIMFFPIVISFIIGAIIDFELLFIPNIAELSLLWNLLYLSFATVFVGVALNIIVYTELPLPALDQFCMAIAKRFKITFGQGKYIGEFIALLGTVIAGLFFKSQEYYFYLGFTTIYYVLVLGLVIDRIHNPLFRFFGVKTLELYADDMTKEDINKKIWRKASRAIIIKDQKVLLIYQTNSNIYTLPGGGLEKWETYERCLKREILEETGYSIKIVEEKVVLKEYFMDSSWENHYFIAKLKNDEPDETKIKLTKEERKTGMEVRWIELFDAIDILDNHDTDHPDGMQIMYREFLGLINSI